MDNAHSNKRTASTTLSWEWRKIPVRRTAPGTTAPEAPLPKRGTWNRREPLTLTVQYRGGSEAWIRVKARGRTYHFTGGKELLTALLEIWE